MSQRVRFARCRTAFLIADDLGSSPVECPKCGAAYQVAQRVLPEPVAVTASPAVPAGPSVFVPSEAAAARSSRRLWTLRSAGLAVCFLVAIAALVLWPRFRPRTTDPVERVAEDYLQALVDQDIPAQRRLSTIDEPPAIQSFRELERDRGEDRTLKGSFAPLAALHRRIEADYAYDPDTGRFTPRRPLGAAGEALDILEAAKEEAKKSGLYDKMASGDPDDLFDAAENYGKMFTKLAEGALRARKILPRYQALVEDARPPIPSVQKELAAEVGGAPPTWNALLGRPFHTLKADGPFVFDRAEVRAQVIDRLASLGDPPTILRLSMVRFRLEGIDTGWRIVAARRELPGGDARSGSNPEPLPVSPGNPAATPPNE